MNYICRSLKLRKRLKQVWRSAEVFANFPQALHASIWFGKQILQRYDSHDSDWQKQMSFSQQANALIQDDIALPYVLQKQQSDCTNSLSITQLAKHHSKQLIPTSEMLHIAVSIILANIVVKLSPIQKIGELGKNVFVVEHNSHLILTAKLRNHARFVYKCYVKDCISIDLMFISSL